MQRRNLKVEVGVNKSGFTLVEILVVVIIVGLLGGLGGGLYIGSYKRLLVEKAARDFLLTAKYARVMAIEKQRQYKIVLDPINNGFHLETTQIDEEEGQTEKVIVRDSFCKPVRFEGETQFEDVQITPIGSETANEEDEEEQSIVFSANGTAQTSKIQIGNGKTHYTISILSATGKAKIHEGIAENVQIGVRDRDLEADL
jgi:prepilin-type N-terminal cleavage/methylation domain-containing protein